MDLVKGDLQEYLRHKLGAQAELVSESKFPRGSSRITWFADVRPGPGEPIRSIVLRGDHPGGSTIPTSLEQEYFMYERLGRTDVPVAKTLWWEADSKWTDRPFYVRDQVEGSWEIPNFENPDPQYDALRIEISKEHMRKLAIVHNVDWKAHGFDEKLSAPTGVEDCAAHFIENLMGQLRAFQQEPMPIATEAVAVLKAEAPVAPRLSLCKGTNGLGEEVFKDGVIVAMSDWEEASIGDPAADFSTLQNFIPEIERDGEKLWGLEHALEYYRSVSKIDVTVESVRFYQRVRAFNTIIYGHKAGTVTHSGEADIRQAWTGTEITHLGKRMTAAAIGMVKPLDPAWFAELNMVVS